MIADQQQPTNLGCDIEQARAIALAIIRAWFVQSAVKLFHDDQCTSALPRIGADVR